MSKMTRNMHKKDHKMRQKKKLQLEHSREQRQHHSRGHERVGHGAGSTVESSGARARASAGAIARSGSRVRLRTRTSASAGAGASAGASSGVGSAGGAGRVRSGGCRVGGSAGGRTAGGGRRRVAGGGRRTAVGAGSVGGLDALVRTAGVGPLVGVGGVVVGDGDGLHVHREGSLGVVGLTASPLDGSLAVVGVTTGPDTETQLHGSLGEARAALGLVVLDSANRVAVNEPGDGFLGPVDSVGVEGLLGSVQVDPGLAIVGSGVALAEVVGFDSVREATNALLFTISMHITLMVLMCAYPVNLVEVVRLHDDTADNTGTRSSLHLDLDATKEEVVLGVNGRRITLLIDGKGSTIVVESHFASSSLPAVERRVLGEVGAESVLLLAIIGGAGLYSR